MTTATFRPATEKQVAFIAKLAAERGAIDNAADLSTAEASARITQLLAMPRVAVATAANDVARVSEPGMYRNAAGALFKVQLSDAGNLYAKALVPIGGQRLTDTDAVIGFEFTYAPGAMRELTADMRLSLDDAKAFGIRYGVCCVCGRTLKDAKSVANGIGPICARNV